jgi:putative DNA primase/helicase
MGKRSATTAVQPRGKGIQDIIALKFAHEYTDTFRYVAVWGQWLEWTGTYWRQERTRKVFNHVRLMLRRSQDGAAKPDIRTVTAVVTLAGADRQLAATDEQWNRDPLLLGTPAGTVDLRSGKIEPARPDDYITKLTAVAPDPKCPTPLWTAFLDRITNGDVTLQRYQQRVCGYCLTGNTSEEVLFFSYGEGANGKGTFWETTSGIIGDYHMPALEGTFTAKPHDHHPTELASLHGARLVTASETEEGRHWNEARIKRVTGGGAMSARFMRQDLFNFIPQFKLSVDSNHKPRVRTVDEAFRRRLNLIPFSVTIPKTERDIKLKHKLRREWPGILAWMIDGCLMWQREGLNPPPVVVQATEEYFDSEDALGPWLDECCEQGPEHWLASNVACWGSYKNWAQRANEPIGSQKEFSQRMKRKFIPYRNKYSRGFRGLRVRDYE